MWSWSARVRTDGSNSNRTGGPTRRFRNAARSFTPLRTKSRLSRKCSNGSPRRPADIHSGLMERKLALTIATALALLAPAAERGAAQQERSAPAAAPADVKPGSINCEDVPYPYPSSYLPLTLYGQDVRMAFMDVAPSAAANGHTGGLAPG